MGMKDPEKFNDALWDSADSNSPKKKAKNIEEINKKTANSGKAFKDKK